MNVAQLLVRDAEKNTAGPALKCGAGTSSYPQLAGLHAGRLRLRATSGYLASLREAFETRVLLPEWGFRVYPLADASRAHADLETGIARRPVLVSSTSPSLEGSQCA